MKRKQWKVLLATKAGDCKHTQFICSECGTLIQQVAAETKTTRLQRDRALKRLAKAMQESGVEE